MCVARHPQPKEIMSNTQASRETASETPRGRDEVYRLRLSHESELHPEEASSALAKSRLVAPMGALTEVCVPALASSWPEEPPAAKGTILNTKMRACADLQFGLRAMGVRAEEASMADPCAT
jgi:hypothetical protein